MKEVLDGYHKNERRMLLKVLSGTRIAIFKVSATEGNNNSGGKEMKKVFAAVMASALCVSSLAGCGGSSSSSSTTAAATEAASTTAAASAAAETTAAAAGESSAADTGSGTIEPECSADGPSVTLSWAHSSSTSDRLALATEKMAKEINQASNGRITIEHYPASQMGAERETLEGITLGTVDCAVISCGVVANFSPSVYVTSLPYQIEDYETGWKVYDGDFGKTLGAKTEEEAGWKFLGWCDNSMRMFSNSKHEVKSPADMKGLKIRTMENDIHMQIVNDLGASATPIAFSELYTALQQGTVDGQENGIALTYSMGFNEVVKYMTMYPHIYDPYLVVMSKQTWDSLPDDLKPIVEEYGAKYCQYEREFNQQNEKDYLKEMEDKGLQVYTPTDDEKKQFVDAPADVEDLVRQKAGDEIVDAFKAAASEQ